MKKFKVYDTGRHCYLRVGVKDVIALGIQNKISEFSFLNAKGDMVYLEEDCDLPLFFKAYRKKYGVDLDCEVIDVSLDGDFLKREVKGTMTIKKQNQKGVTHGNSN